MNWDELPGLFPALAEPERWLPLLKAHLAYIAEAGEHTRVTAVAPDDAIQRQYAESLETWRIAVEALGAAPPEVVDVGSGGGYPGPGGRLRRTGNPSFAGRAAAETGSPAGSGCLGRWAGER